MADANQPTRNGGNASGAKGRPTLNAFDPRAPTIVQPFKRLVDEGWIEEIAVVFTPTGVKVSGKASAKLVAVENSGLNQADSFPLAVLARVAELGNCIPKPGKKGKGVGGAPAPQALPAKSLVKSDFAAAKSAASLQARANAVAAAAGGAPLVGRVRSAGRFLGTETTTYQDWWAVAAVADRALSLCQGRYLAALTNEEKARLAGLQCPFRGTLEFVVAAEEEEEEDEGVGKADTPEPGKPGTSSSSKK